VQQCLIHHSSFQSTHWASPTVTEWAGGYSPGKIPGKSALDMLSNNYFCHVVLIGSSETLAGPGGDRASDAETAQCHSAGDCQ
jgi:hypothetical protein